MNQLKEILEGIQTGETFVIDIYDFHDQQCPKCGKTKCLSVGVSFGCDIGHLTCSKCHFSKEVKINRK